MKNMVPFWNVNKETKYMFSLSIFLLWLIKHGCVINLGLPMDLCIIQPDIHAMCLFALSVIVFLLLSPLPPDKVNQQCSK